MTCAPTDVLLLFDFADHKGRLQRLCFEQPLEVIAAHTLAEVKPALRAVEQATAAGLYAGGYVSYEAAPAFDSALTVRPGASWPLLWFGLFHAPAVAALDERACAYQLSDWTPATAWPDYQHNVAALRAAIARGDTYQANYTIRLRARFRGDDLAFYQHLAARQQARYCAYLNTGRQRILSASPELFFHWRNQEIITRPMKGTARRGRWLEEDEQQTRWLANSEKNRAENIMIVDLMRNDLGRIAQTGTVEVRELCRVEHYPTVLQMTSTVAAQTRPDITLSDIFAALFPSGSVTGAPKVSTMRLIAAREDSPRHVYCGSVGFVTPAREAVFNVAIRTALVDTETESAEYGIGGGITWDSTATDEYHEALTKAALLTYDQPQFQLLETLKLEHGQYTLLTRHLDRLTSSAHYFAYPFSLDDARAALTQHAQTHAHEARRVRLLLSQNGTLHVESAPLDEPSATPAPVALATTPVLRANVFLYHKTTRRDLYEQHRARHPRAFDVLLWNEDGELTEFTNGNLVVELAGRRYTPPRACGLLAGTLRAELLAQGEIEERIITRAQLARCARLWLINSVRGWLPVQLQPGDHFLSGNN